MQARRHNHIGRFALYRRALTSVGREAIDNAVFHPLCAILGIANSFVLANKIHFEAAANRNVLLPIQMHHAVIQLVIAGCGDFRHMQDDSVRQA